MEHPEFLQLDSIVNKMYNIECSDNKLKKIVKNAILSQYLELKLSHLWNATISGHQPLF